MVGAMARRVNVSILEKRTMTFNYKEDTFSARSSALIAFLLCRQPDSQGHRTSFNRTVSDVSLLTKKGPKAEKSFRLEV